MRLIDADSLKEKLCILGEHRIERLVEKEPTVDVLDKIRAEIERKTELKSNRSVLITNAYMDCLQIINKYTNG